LYEYVRSKPVADVDSEGTQAYGVRPYVQPSTGGGGEFLVGWGDAIIEGGRLRGGERCRRGCNSDRS